MSELHNTAYILFGGWFCSLIVALFAYFLKSNHLLFIAISAGAISLMMGYYALLLKETASLSGVMGFLVKYLLGLFFLPFVLLFYTLRVQPPINTSKVIKHFM
ncbi:hypothetical protein HGB07_05165, partial [Candidatus Roizmanbacteria bacterium]|nr:hypothetical protein [Candidatus Roizmanbacteria bacterium]